MTIKGHSKHDFGAALNKVLSPSQPISSVQHLHGRQRDLGIIEQALFADGRHVFVYGDRGVGKSSLAHTAAHQYQTSDGCPIIVDGSPDETFKTIVAGIATKALDRSKTEKQTVRRSAGFTWHSLKLGMDFEVSPLEIVSQIQSIGDAAELLKQVAACHSESPIVVLDEFDTISDANERNKFASLLKHLGDQSVNLKFIFTGVGSTVDSLLGAHQSAYRQLHTLDLPRLPWNARWKIVDDAAAYFDLSVDLEVKYRIGIVSDGFPYYVHLITENMLWEAFNDDAVVSVISLSHYQAGIRAAIEGINVELRKPYDKAVSHRPPAFEDVVWCTADGEELFRELGDLYGAYKIICEKRQDRPLLERSRFTETLRKLKTPSYGAILSSLEHRNGWYTYTEKMLRGYVRMQAEVNGVELTGERPIAPQRMHVSTNARTGYRGPSIPRGVRTDKLIRRLDDEDESQEGGIRGGIADDPEGSS